MFNVDMNGLVNLNIKIHDIFGTCEYIVAGKSLVGQRKIVFNMI